MAYTAQKLQRCSVAIKPFKMDSLNNTFSESDLNCDAEQKYSLNIPEGNFKASNGWTWRFMKRFGFTERAATSLGQNIPVNAKDLALNYLKWIQTHCKGIALSNIGGLDETPLQAEMPGYLIFLFLTINF